MPNKTRKAKEVSTIKVYLTKLNFKKMSDYIKKCLGDKMSMK